MVVVLQCKFSTSFLCSVSNHLLTVNAAYLGPKSTTVDGYDHTFQVNFLSHFYLTNLLVRRRLLKHPAAAVKAAAETSEAASLPGITFMETVCQFSRRIFVVHGGQLN
jgi:NAD(P)-dependent dehydrogenase (short-subunit alcohol dehydrogenase family)